MGKKTPLYPNHCAANAKIVDFAGWDMPLHYGSQLEEHHQVRQAAGVFDVSHMTIVDCDGDQVASFLRYLLANNIDRLTPGKALYTCMLNEQGGVIDDLIVYKITDHLYRLIVNSGTHDKDLAWLNKQSALYNVTLKERTDLAMLAIQGPRVNSLLESVFDLQTMQMIRPLKPFHAIEIADYFIAKTGYTGEDGYEVILPANQAPAFWDQLIAAEIKPCGLGARDTLRLEAGLNLYGSDMDESVTPLEANLAWTVAFLPNSRDFIGRAALEKQRDAGVKYQLVGLVLDGPGVLRNHQKIMIDNLPQGEITSGSFSPTLNKGIGLARVPAGIGSECMVDIRGKQVKARVVAPPFVRHGNVLHPVTV